jgi:flavodoxin
MMRSAVDLQKTKIDIGAVFVIAVVDDSLKAIILFDTRYGNTEKVAKALMKGIRASISQVTCLNISDVEAQELAQYDFLAVGGPTEYRTASESMKAFLSGLKQAKLEGKYGFAFDTRIDTFWAGSAAKPIENELKALGLRIVRPHSSAYVIRADKSEEESVKQLGKETKQERKARKAKEKEERRASAILTEGMEELFENLGNEIGKTLAANSIEI